MKQKVRNTQYTRMCMHGHLTAGERAENRVPGSNNVHLAGVAMCEDVDGKQRWKATSGVQHFPRTSKLMEMQL